VSGVSTAISWILGQEPAGIILEDDVRPSPDFFRFASELLARYADDGRVWSIGGLNVDPLSVVSGQRDSYRFSAFPLVWGWATWARAWEGFALDMSDWPAWLDLDEVSERHRLPYPARVLLWSRFSQVASGKVNTWAIPWMARSLSADALHVVPCRNLTQNVGIFNDSRIRATAMHCFGI